MARTLYEAMLAPMEGVSHPTFRQLIAEKGGVSIVCTEFVRISRAALSHRALRREVVKSPLAPLSVQVMGSDAEKMSEAAGIVAASGADVVDINLGCPAPKAVRSGAGAAMLKDLSLLAKVLKGMREAVPGTLSAKIRAGFDTRAHVLEIAHTVQDAGIDYIVVHPRRRSDFYEGVADWRIIAKLKEALSIPVIGNGDIWYAEDALRMQRETGADGVMIGRPALRNPWIFSQIASLRDGSAPVEPDAEMILAYVQEVVGRYRLAFPKARNGPVGKLKELMSFLATTIDDDGVFRKQVLRAKTIEEMLDHTRRTYETLTPEQLDIHAAGPLRLKVCGSTV